MPKSPKGKKRLKPKQATRRPDASQTALSIVESIIGGKLVEQPIAPAKRSKRRS